MDLKRLGAGLLKKKLPKGQKRPIIKKLGGRAAEMKKRQVQGLNHYRAS